MTSFRVHILAHQGPENNDSHAILPAAKSALFPNPLRNVDWNLIGLSYELI
jgi:hypothetical protein